MKSYLIYYQSNYPPIFGWIVVALALGNVFLFYSYKSPKTIKPQICIRSPFYFTEQVPLLPNLGW